MHAEHDAIGARDAAIGKRLGIIKPRARGRRAGGPARGLVGKPGRRMKRAGISNTTLLAGVAGGITSTARQVGAAVGIVSACTSTGRARRPSSAIVTHVPATSAPDPATTSPVVARTPT